MTPFVRWLTENLNRVEIVEPTEEVLEGELVTGHLDGDLRRLWCLYTEQGRKMHLLAEELYGEVLGDEERELKTTEYLQIANLLEALKAVVAYEFGQLCGHNGSVTVREGFQLVFVTNEDDEEYEDSAANALSIFPS